MTALLVCVAAVSGWLLGAGFVAALLTRAIDRRDRSAALRAIPAPRTELKSSLHR